MLQLEQYRSVPLRKVTVSPSRRAVIEVVLKRAPGEASGADGTNNAEGKNNAGGDAATHNGAQATPVSSRQASPRKGETPSTIQRSASPGQSSSARPRPPSVNLSNVESLGTQYPINSPRSLNLCKEFGIHPDELVPRSLPQFKARGVPDHIAQLRFEHFEQRRKHKLDILCQERENRINGVTPSLTLDSQLNGRSASRTSDSGAAAATIPMSLLPRYTQELLLRATPRGNTGANDRTPAGSSTARPALNGRDRSTAANAFNHDLLRHQEPAITAAMREERAQAVIEKENRRRLVYERAQREKEERQYESMTKQVLLHRRSESQLQMSRQLRQSSLEEQRLRREDTLQQIKLKRAQEQVLQTKIVQTAIKVHARSSSVDTRDRFKVQLAKSLYLTPRQRTERARSASANRSSTPVR
jgi:hypothetical protein